MSSPSDITVDLSLVGGNKEQKPPSAKRSNLESQLFQDTYEVEFSSTSRNVQSSVEDWIDVPHVDFEGQSSKSTSFNPNKETNSAKVPARHTLSAFGSFNQGSGSNYSIGSQLTDSSHMSYQNGPGELSLNISSQSGSFRLPNHQQFTPTGGVPMNQQFSPSVFRPRLGMDQHQQYRVNGGYVIESPPSVHTPLSSGHTPLSNHHMHGGGFFSSHESSFQSLNGYISNNTSQSDMSMFAEDVPPDNLIFVVQFKTTCRDYILGVRIPSIVKVGDKVIVSADRGEDMGTVTEIISYDQFLFQRFQLVRPLTTYFNLNKFVGRILRFASEREVRTLGMKLYDENEVVKYGVHLINHVYRLNMTIYDAEFQFDRHKLTIYYDCMGRVDFREFVKAVHVTFNARVWMEKVNSNSLPSVVPPLNGNSNGMLHPQHAIY